GEPQLIFPSPPRNLDARASRPQLIFPPGGAPQEPMEALNINLRNRVVPRTIQAPPVEATSTETPIIPNPQGEYDILQQLAKILAKITIHELIQRSPSHLQTMIKFLQGITVREDLSAAEVAQAIMSLCVAPSIVFHNDEWAPKECQSLPLCLTI